MQNGASSVTVVLRYSMPLLIFMKDILLHFAKERIPGIRYKIEPMNTCCV